MTSVEIYAFFVSPFVMGAFVLLTVWLTGWQDRREGFRRDGARRAAAHASSGSSPSSSIPNPDRPT